MANQLNKPKCLKRYGNTAVGDCYFDVGKIKGGIQVPSDFVITKADLPDLQEFLEAALLAPIGQRIFIYHGFIGLTDNTEEQQIETTDYGTKLFTRDGDYDMTFRYLKGGVQLHQEIQKNSGGGKSWLFYDENNALIGYNTKEGLKGIPDVLFLTPPWRVPTGSTSAQFLLRFIFSPLYLNYGNLGFMIPDFNIFDLKGLQDVTLELVGLAGNVATVLAYTKISNVNLFQTYSTNLSQAAAWKAVDEDGNNITITTVTPNAAAQGSEGGFTVTFSSVPFNAADKVYLELVDPDVLAEAPILVTGYDVSEALEIEAPGS